MNSNYVQRILFTLKIQGPPTLSLCIAHLFIYSIFYIYIYIHMYNVPLNTRLRYILIR